MTISLLLAITELALVQLGYTEIPVIRKDFSKEYSELAEIDENLNWLLYLD